MSNTFAEYAVKDLFSHIDGLTSKRMFGGYGLYVRGLIFAIIVDDEVYMKVCDKNLADYIKYNSEPFRYKGRNGKVVTMSYWKLPAEIMDDKLMLSRWVEASLSCHEKLNFM